MGKKSPCLSCKHKNVYEPLTKCFVCNFSGIECKNFEMYKPNSQTNADKIRAMSDEEMANEFSGQCPAIFGGTRMSGEECAGFESCQECWLDWLRQEEA